MYPAVIGEWAELLPSDEGEIALIRPLLAGTAIETVPLRLAYDADRDGWDAEAFHERLNTFGAAVVIAKTIGGAVLGGYNPSGAHARNRHSGVVAQTSDVTRAGGETGCRDSRSALRRLDRPGRRSQLASCLSVHVAGRQHVGAAAESCQGGRRWHGRHGPGGQGPALCAGRAAHTPVATRPQAGACFREQDRQQAQCAVVKVAVVTAFADK